MEVSPTVFAALFMVSTVDAVVVTSSDFFLYIKAWSPSRTLMRVPQPVQ